MAASDDRPPRPRRPTISERVERSRAGQIVIAVAVTVVLLAEVGTHLPGSSFQRAVSHRAGLVAQWTASEQTWAVFAPDPRTTSLGLEAEVTFADGTSARWTLPDGPIVGANLRYYRWRKWLESVRADARWPLWEPTARWIASEYGDRGVAVVRVDLVRYFHEDVTVGPTPPWQTYTYYTLHLDPDG